MGRKQLDFALNNYLHYEIAFIIRKQFGVWTRLEWDIGCMFKMKCFTVTKQNSRSVSMLLAIWLSVNNTALRK